MPKSQVLGNGSLLICFDKTGYVRDFYYPNVGLENHVGHYQTHKIGVFVDSTFSWLHDPGWEIHIGSESESMVGKITATNATLGITLYFTDIVYNEKNIFLRKVIVHNTSDQAREIKVFFNQEFEIYGNRIGDTGYFDPFYETVIHYKGQRIFLINARCDGKRFDEYSIGIFGREGKEGTYKDAEDGSLTKNPIEHGPVDSVIGFTLNINPNEEKIIDYWIIASQTMRDARQLNSYILERTPDHLIQTTKDYWHTWVNKQNFNFFDLDPMVVDVFKKSLFMVRSHVDNNGSIIASCDSDMLKGGKDTYCYLWPRDAALVAIALDKAGDYNVSRRFFELANELISDEGYFLHKYRPDKSLGSSWHPWVRNDSISLPIQEDETSLVIIALWKHYQHTKDLEFIEGIYNSMIKKAGDFMLFYRDKVRGLPEPSYDLWEEKHGIHTFTAATVFEALLACAKFANLLGKKEAEAEYTTAAFDLKKAIMQYLYDPTEKIFYKMVNIKGNETLIDKTVDMSSIYGIFKFNVLDVEDPVVVDCMHISEERLQTRSMIKGLARYENDSYFKSADDVPGNPWIITTLWLTQYNIARAKTPEDLATIREWIKWVAEKAIPSGVLPEQFNPHTGEPLSTAPLTWSHAEYVVTVIEYLEKLEALGICKACNPVR